LPATQEGFLELEDLLKERQIVDIADVKNVPLVEIELALLAFKLKESTNVASARSEELSIEWL